MFKVGGIEIGSKEDVIYDLLLEGLFKIGYGTFLNDIYEDSFRMKESSIKANKQLELFEENNV